MAGAPAKPGVEELQLISSAQHLSNNGTPQRRARTRHLTAMWSGARTGNFWKFSMSFRCRSAHANA